jgi:RNA recognition motif-containing protein
VKKQSVFSDVSFYKKRIEIFFDFYFCEQIFQRKSVNKKRDYDRKQKDERKTPRAVRLRYQKHDKFNVQKGKQDKTQYGDKNVEHGRSKNKQQCIHFFIH